MQYRSATDGKTYDKKRIGFSSSIRKLDTFDADEELELMLVLFFDAGISESHLQVVQYLEYG